MEGPHLNFRLEAIKWVSHMVESRQPMRDVQRTLAHHGEG